MSEFDYDAYRDQLADTVLDAFEKYHRKPDYDAHDALSEAVFDAADKWMAHEATGEKATDLLDASRNEPTEWMPHAEGKSDWREVVRAMAFTVVRQDAYDVLEEQGYLDEHRNATEKLKQVGKAEA